MGVRRERFNTNDNGLYGLRGGCMTFENQRGGSRSPELEALSSKLAEDTAKFLAKPKTKVKPCDSSRVSTVAEAKKLIDVSKILKQKKKSTM